MDQNLELHFHLFFICYLEFYRLLIKYGANINSQTYAGDTAAHLGAYRGYLDVVKILVDNGSDVWIMNVSGHDVIQEAQSKGQSHIVKYIRDKEFQGLC